MARHAACARCRRALSNEELQSRDLMFTEHGPICDDCAATYRAGLDVARQADALRDAPSPAASVVDPAPEQEDAAAPAPAADEAPDEPELKPETEAQKDALDLLDDIRRETEAIRRTVLFDKTSTWNVLGAVTQCFALGALVMACVRWGSGPEPMLLVAILLQLMTLTFFFHGK